MTGIFFLIAVLIVKICLSAIKKWRRMEKCAENIPVARKYSVLSFLKAKNTHDLLKLTLDLMRNYQELGIAKKWIGGYLVVGIWDPKYIEIIANSPHAAEKAPLMGALLQNIGAGIFATTDISLWRVLRKPLTKLLTRKYLENEHHNVFLSKNKKFVKFLMEKRCGKEINVKKELQNLTTDIFSETHLGVETNELEETRFKFLYYFIRFVNNSMNVGAFVHMNKQFGFLKPLTMNSKLKKASIDAREFISWILQERMKKTNMNENYIYYPDFLLKRKMEQNLALDDIARELLDVVFAGTDTSAITLSSILLFLAMFPEVQEEAYQEQVSIFGDKPIGEPTPEDLCSMVYLTRIIKETLRFCSPPMVLKQATGDIQVDDYTIPKGTIIIIAIDVVCFDERYWEKPKTFYPDHFLPEKEAERPTFAYPVFGIGPRICPGIQYAMNSMKTIMSFILRNFRVSTSAKFEDLNIQYNLMRELNTYMVKFEVRSQQQH